MRPASARSRSRSPAPATAPAPAPRRGRRVTLDDVYAEDPPRAVLSGIQAVVRLVLEQRRLDRRWGLDTAAFVSGYEGSPLGGLDLELARAGPRWLAPAGVTCCPGLNEELAATAVAGTQLVDRLPGPHPDGVVGFWYGKNPGFERATDAVRHGIYAGTRPLGGVVALIGDDPSCKSSTLPSFAVAAASSLHLPLLSPGTVADVVRLGLHAVALSRASGLWAGLQMVTEVADGSAVVDLGGARPDLAPPDPDRADRHPLLVGAQALEAEEDLLEQRLPRAVAYARRAGLNRLTVSPPGARLGVLASGPAFAALGRALEDLGLDRRGCARVGLRVARIDLPWPLDPATVRELAAGLDEVLVIEDKDPVVERQVKAALYGTARSPRVVGKRDHLNRPLVPSGGAVDADTVARVLAARLLAITADLTPNAHPTPNADPSPNAHPTSNAHPTPNADPSPNADPTDPADLDTLVAAASRLLPASLAKRLAQLRPPPHPLVLHPVPDPDRTPPPARTAAFCSGCPHSVSTRAGADQLVGLGIGCHLMAAFDPDGRGRQLGMTQMGGEGAQWIGMAPYAGGRHYVQNLGDGTFFHSGSLAVRAAVAAGVDLTFKLLYNGAVAMTGGQPPQGLLTVSDLTRLLALEGVRRIVVTTSEPERYRQVALDPIAEVRHRDRLQQAMDELAEVKGVTVLIHDDLCAAEQRRLRHRGRLPEPASRVWINQRVCEGCGDCGEKSRCLSVVPVDTPFGRKTAIHQSSCNDDLSCLRGNCPSFVRVTPAPSRPRPPLPDPPLPDPPFALPAPSERRTPDDLVIRMPGIGGTGVVTLSRLVQMAAHLDGRFAAGLDQTGLAQKGGPVISDVRLSRRPITTAVRAGARSVDLLLGLDRLGLTAEAGLSVADPGRTVAVVNTAEVATAAMVRNPSLGFPRTTTALDRATRASENLSLDAQWVAERLCGDHLPANLVMLGAAYQHGCLPVSAEAIEEAIALHGTGARQNLAAFRWGRAAVVDPAAVQAALAPPAPPAPLPPAALQLLLDSAPAVLRPVLDRRVADLAGYQSTRYARRYLDQVLEVARTERQRTGDPALAVATAFAKGLYALMAYKDEYEVARLHLDPAERAALRDAFGPGARRRVLLQPPVLTALGLRHKISLGPAAVPAFHLLRAARHLRGTPFDPFGRAAMRRAERALLAEYRRLVSGALDRLCPQNASTVAELAALGEEVRGYDEVKRRSIRRFHQRAAELAARLDAAEPAGARNGPSANPAAVTSPGPSTVTSAGPEPGPVAGPAAWPLAG